MDSRPDRLPRVAAPLAVALTALGWWFGTHLEPLWWAAWLAPLPLLVYALRVRAGPASLAAFAAFAIGGANAWHYLHDVVRVPLVVTLAAILAPALLMVPVTLLFRALARRGRVLAAALSLPLATTGLSWAGATLSAHGTYGHLAYSQMDALPVIQVAAVAGLWGVGFLVWLPASLLAAVTAPRADRRDRVLAATAGTLVLALSLGYGAWRLHDDDASTRLRVGLVTIGGSGDAAADPATPEGGRMLSRYAAEIERLAAAGAEVVVAPESALLLRSHAVETLQELSTRHGVRILVGAEDHSDPRRKHNAALVFEPGAGEPVAYYKRHLIPGFEDRYTPGDTRVMLAGAPRTGVAICKDLDFTATGRAHAALDTQLLLVPAWDFNEDAWLHGRMAVMRGVEGGFAIARTARDGDLTLSDDRGRVIAEASSVGKTGPVSLLAELPLRDTRTPYARWGDAFGWLSLIAAALLAATLALRRKHGDSPRTNGPAPRQRSRPTSASISSMRTSTWVASSGVTAPSTMGSASAANAAQKSSSLV
ncbi:nitrilase-related carbon-nitrogen hydrolase [Luteimonas sp. R10]|uniref:nitrilase-related carbon-nitrogen hydrolase n=1 Tax=Luteimonas sp. R10 TaxID=3108176 RepID=UPI00308ADE7D|nr:nitrilase-related carbon-nitrogen hydrolase [Luteimonas sp. R10]